MTRPLRPDDLYRFRIATDPRLSPDGSRVVFTVQTVAPGRDGYRHALWSVPTDGDARQLTIGAKHDRHPRFAKPVGSQYACPFWAVCALCLVTRCCSARSRSAR